LVRYPPDFKVDLSSRQRGIKTDFPTTLICTTRRWVLASASTNQGPKKGGIKRRFGPAQVIARVALAKTV